jgi:hypothetical protein
MSLFACSYPVSIFLHDAMVVEAGRLPSGSVEFRDKSYNSFGVSVESLATFNKFKLYPYIINNKIENLRTICNEK